MIIPNFLIIGAPRSGTTMLYDVLAHHPDVYMSPFKEPKYFCDETRFSLEQYHALFDGHQDEALAGEASSLYLYDAQAPQRIRDYNPDMKLIAVLRNPMQRAWSHYLQHRYMEDRTSQDFREVLDTEDVRIREGKSAFTYYRQVGYYGEQVKRYLSIFPKEQMLFLLHRDLVRDREATLLRVFEFLEIDREVAVNLDINRNPSGKPKHPWFHRLLRQPHWFKDVAKRLIPKRVWLELFVHLMNTNLQKPQMPEDIRWELLEGYREDIAVLHELTGLDVSGWLESK